MNRDELIKEFKSWDTWASYGQIADFVLAREKAILDAVEKPLREYSRGLKALYEPDSPERNSDFSKAIDAALSAIEKMRGGK